MNSRQDPAVSPGDDAPGLPWRELLGSLGRHLKLIVACGVAGALVLGVGKFLEPPMYRSHAALTLVANRADVKMSPNDATALQNDRVDEMLVNSEAAWFRSESALRDALVRWRDRWNAPRERGIVAGVLDAVWLPFRLPGIIYRRIHGAAQPDAYDMIVSSLSNRLSVETTRVSNVIELSFTDSSPAFAAQVLEALIALRMKRQASFSQQDEAASFYEEQSRLLAERVQEAETALQSFYDQEGIVGGSQERDAVRTNLAEARTEFSKTNTELAELRTREQYLAKTLAGLPRHVTQAADPSSSMEGRVLELMLERSKLLARYAPTSVKIVDLDQQIAEAKRLMREEERLIASASAATNPTYAEMEQQLIETRAQVASLEARAGALQRQEHDLVERMRALVQGTSTLERLETDLARAKEAHRTYVGKQESARLSSALDASEILNINVTQPVTVPNTPMPARRGVMTLLGGLAGLILGAAIACVRDFLDPTVKSADEVTRLTGMPIIGEVTS
jgi:uncharacterized protein involved in exopolysaccharide biosynthesis